jgi:hypothetical protein
MTSIGGFIMRSCDAILRLLMEAGADARKGIFPHRDATSALVIASDRQYSDVVAVIEEEERQRREKTSNQSLRFKTRSVLLFPALTMLQPCSLLGAIAP